MREHVTRIVKGGLLVGTISAIIRFLLNYYLRSIPETHILNAKGHDFYLSLSTKICVHHRVKGGDLEWT